MIVYVETNFVLELALGQEESESARDVLELTSNRNVELCIPAFSLVEPFWALSGQKRRRDELLNLLQREGRALGRTRAWGELAESVGRISEQIQGVDNAALMELEDAVRQLLASATVLDLNASVLDAALAINLQIDLSIPDAVVLASIGEHLRVQPSLPDSIFISKDRKDFGDPLITQWLRERGCRYIPSIQNGLRWIEARLGGP